MKRKAFTNGQRKAQCIHALVYNLQAYQREACTCADIARYMGVEPSTKLRNMLAELAEGDFITISREESANIVGFRFMYSLPQNIIDEALAAHRREQASARQIVIRKYGKREEVATI